jgi:hypothetical protein
MPPPDAGVCKEAYAACDPVADKCCGAGSRCDSIDDGATYACKPYVIE